MSTETRQSSSNIYVSMEQLRKLQFFAKGFSFLPKQPVNSILSGKNVSKLRGRGLNFEELRHYRPGDDIRSMDWKVTRRTGKPHIKVYTEERERNVYLFIDQRSSMFFGSVGKTKSVIAAELAALSAWQISSIGDRVGAIIFNDNEVSYVPAKRGVSHIISLLSALEKKNKQLKSGQPLVSSQQSFEQALIKLSQICGHNALVIMISDGYGWNANNGSVIKKIRQHNELISCYVFDQLEQKFPTMSQMVVSDGQQQIQFSSSDAAVRKKYQESLQQLVSAYEYFSQKHGIPFIPINTVEPVNMQLRNALGKR
ncbi:DUF58 domain-containing protein [Thalassotalea sp. PLHSN55]|uniref:DUF58 domain-containing protein n=1 Tax=Thalassotalea sp. PLHSN55 TaxID=3435888 RepID=UPI003F85AE59